MNRQLKTRIAAYLAVSSLMLACLPAAYSAEPVYVNIPGFEKLEFSGCMPASEEDCFWVCSDENKKVVWKINAASGAIEAFSWEKKKLNDMEGLCGDGRGGALVLCSQSLNKRGEPRDSRQRLSWFTSESWDGGDRFTIEGFRQILLNDFEWLQAYSEKLPKQGGLDVEGIAYDAQHDMLILGFRGPLVSAADPAIAGDNAILLLLDGFMKRWESGVLGENNKWEDKGNPRLLDLGGLGIRDLYLADSGNLIILAGELGGNAPGEHPPQKLFHYDWRSGATPTLLMNVEQVPSQMGTDVPWSAAEGVCDVSVNGNPKLVVVYDSEKSGIYRVIDIPER